MTRRARPGMEATATHESEKCAAYEYFIFNTREVIRLQGIVDDLVMQSKQVDSRVKSIADRLHLIRALRKKIDHDIQSQPTPLFDDMPRDRHDPTFLQQLENRYYPPRPAVAPPGSRTVFAYASGSILLTPIGLVRTAFQKRSQAPRQPFVGFTSDGTVQLFDPRSAGTGSL